MINSSQKCVSLLLMTSIELRSKGLNIRKKTYSLVWGIPNKNKEQKLKHGLK